MTFNRSHLLTFLSLLTGGVLYILCDTSIVFAKTTITYTPLSPNLPLDIGTSITGLPDFLNKLFTATIVAGAILAVIMVAIGGFEYMTTDSVFSIGNAKDRIEGAIGGLFVILASILFLTTINPNIVNLKLFSPDSSSSSGSSATATKTETNADGTTTVTYSDGTKKVYDTTAGTVTYYDSSGKVTKIVNEDESVTTYSSGGTGASGGTGGTKPTTGTQTAGNGAGDSITPTGGGTAAGGDTATGCVSNTAGFEDSGCTTAKPTFDTSYQQVPEVYDSSYYNNDTDAERYDY